VRSNTGKVALCHAQDHQRTVILQQRSRNRIAPNAFSGDGKTFLFVCDNGICYWDVVNSTIVQPVAATVLSDTGEVVWMDVERRHNTVAVVGQRQVCLVDLSHTTQPQTLSVEEVSYLRCKWNPIDSHTLALSNPNRGVSLLDTRSLSIVEQLQCKNNSIRDMSFSCYGTYLAIATDKGTQLWDLRKNRLVMQFGARGYHCTFSPTWNALVMATSPGWCNQRDGVQLWRPNYATQEQSNKEV